MSNDTILIRGYAVPFSQSTLYGEEQLLVAPGAFDRMLAGPLPAIDLRWGGHGDDAEIVAHSRDGELTLFSDAYGLGFSCRLDRCHLPKIAQVTAAGASPADRCSANILVDDELTETRKGVQPLRTIKRASIDHIAIGLRHAAFAGTAIWIPDCGMENAPWRIQKIAGMWNAGHAAYIAKRTARVVTAATVASAASSPGELRGPRGPLPPEAQRRLSALLNARHAKHQVARQGLCHEFANLGPHGSTQIFGSAALGRSFGVSEITAMLRGGKVR
jgi:Caudovirus prohead serine protease